MISIVFPNVSSTPITAMGCQQCLPLTVVQLKGKHCRKPYCPNEVEITYVLIEFPYLMIALVIVTMTVILKYGFLQLFKPKICSL